MTRLFNWIPTIFEASDFKWAKFFMPGHHAIANDIKNYAPKFCPHFTQLNNAKKTLATSTIDLEKQFWATSSELMELSQLSDQFVTQVVKLVGLATGKECDSTVFAASVEMIEKSIHFLDSYLEQSGHILECLRDYHLQIEDLLNAETELRRIMAPLKFVQVLFKSESAPLGIEIQQTFESLTQEIESLNTQVQEIFGTKFQQLHQTQQIIGQVIGKLEAQLQSLRQITSIHKAKIESSLENFRQEMALNKERDIKLDQLSRQIEQDVQQVVSGLQFQDIFNQKMQHVSLALPQIEVKYEEFKASPNKTVATDQLRFIHQFCRLQNRQIEVSGKELSQAEADIHKAIQHVLTSLTEVDSCCLSLEEFKLLTTSYDGVVQVLLEAIEETRNLVTITVANATDAYEMLRPLGSLASDLTSVVRSLSVRVHLIGLNAQVQAAHTIQHFPGTGLEVLSARTTDITTESNRISEKASTQLDQVAAGLAQNVDAFNRLKADGLSHHLILNEQGRAEEQQLHAFRDSALGTLRVLGDSLDDIQKHAKQTLQAAHFKSFHEIVLPELRLPLQAIAEMAEHDLQQMGSSVAEENILNGFEKCYTVASERKIFDEIIPPRQQADTSIPGATATVTGPEIILFSDPAPNAGSPKEELKNAIPLIQGNGIGGNVELF